MRWRGTVPVSLGSRSEAEEQGTQATPKEKQTTVQQELVASHHFADQLSLARVAHKHSFKSKYSGPSGSLKSLGNPEEVEEDQTYCRHARLAITDARIADRPLTTRRPSTNQRTSDQISSSSQTPQKMNKY